MADEKILNNEIITDEQLDSVSGGSYDQSYSQMMFLTQMGISFFPNDKDASVNKLGGLYQHAGIRFEAHNDKDHANKYFNAATGESIESGAAFTHLVNTINAYRARGVIVN